MPEANAAPRLIVCGIKRSLSRCCQRVGNCQLVSAIEASWRRAPGRRVCRCSGRYPRSWRSSGSARSRSRRALQYTNSTLALDLDTGTLKGYHQYTPHDSWDWDEVSAPLLIDTEIDGKLVKTATHAGRNGYLWILDRNQGQLKFLHALPFSNNNVFTSIDPKTGRPVIDESKRPGAKQGGEFCSSIGGGKDWVPEAWSPQTKLLYVPANNNICAFLPKGVVPKPDARGFYVGYEVESIFGSVRTSAGAADHLGELQAWDLNTGKRVWQHNFNTLHAPPLLVTGGDLVFAGGTPDREFRAFDARTGDELWSFPAPAGVLGVPTSFEVDGEQYVAVTAGWGLDAQGVQNGIDKIQGTKTVVPKS